MSSNSNKALGITHKLWSHEQALPPSNDNRVKGGVIRRCVLCGRRRQLRLSHIIPKWAHKWHRDAWNGKVKGMYLSIGILTEKQDSNKHYLMCDQCEQLAARDERYVRILVAGTRSEKLNERIIEWPSGHYLWIDTSAIARFASITALRCHYAPSPPYHNFNVSHLHRTLLRRKVFHKSSLNDLPWVAAARFVPPLNNPDHDPRCDIFAQYEDNEALGPTFAALIGGWEWYLFFQPKEKILRKLRLQRRFFVRIAVIPYNEYRLFTRMHEITERYAHKLADNPDSSDIRSPGTPRRRPL